MQGSAAMAHRKTLLLIGTALGALIPAAPALAQASASAYTAGIRYDADRRVTG
jgi:hypothetical protein